MDVAQPFTNRVILSGPTACAIENAYRRWVSGARRGAVPSASSFSTTADASTDGFTVTFTPSTGAGRSPTTYAIARSTCVDSSWPTVPQQERYPIGPVVVSGHYVRALIAADAAHADARPAAFTPASSYAYASSLGSGVVIVTMFRGDYNVGFYQSYDPHELIIGCYKEQHYRVSPATFFAWNTTAGCPG